LAKFFDGKTVLITGASSGLGEELSKELFKSTTANLVLASRNKEELEKLRGNLIDSIANRFSNICCYKLDLSEVQSIENFCEQLLSDIPDGIDVLINNAGISVRGDCMSTTMDVHRRLMEVNYFGHVHLTQKLFRNVVLSSEKTKSWVSPQRCIINISSLQGRIEIPYRSAYAASKHAFNAYFDCLKGELMARKIANLSVLTVNPGYLKTNFSFNALTSDGRSHAKMDQGQAGGLEPEMAAKTILEAAVTGQSELLLCSLKFRMAVYIRAIFPGIFFKLIADRAKQQDDE